MPSGAVDTVRLIGINTPERGECFADEAAEALSGLLAPQVAMTSDTSDRDQYGRLLRYLWIGEVFVNEVLVERGFALAREYPPDTGQAARLAAAQQRAETAGVGMWATDACGSASTSVLTIEWIEADAPGNDHDNLNGEWVRIANAGAPVDMTGWVLKDESASHRNRFPSGFVFPTGVVLVYTGCGPNSTTEVFWCNGSAVWNNSGDTAFLLDPNGNIVATRSY